MARQFVEEGAPEIEAPHLGNILLRGVARIGIARGAHIQRDVELDAAPRDVGRVVGIAQRVQRIQADGFGEVEAAVHGARGVRGQHDVGAPGGLLFDADGVGLRHVGFRRRNAELRGNSHALGARDKHEPGGRGIARESAGSAFGQRDAASGERAVDLAGGELNLRYAGFAAQRGGVGLGAK